MRFSLSATSRTLPVIVLFTAAAALAVTSHSGAAVNGHHGSLVERIPSPTCSPLSSPVYCYEIVNENSNDFNYVTGIDNSQQIVGAYSSSSGGSYTSFIGEPQTVTQNNLTPYTLTTEKDGSYSTYLAGLDDGSSSNAYQVGYVVEGSATLGALLHSGIWSTIQEPNQGTGSCAVTEVLSIFDQRIAVGFYETNGTGATCIKHAFEVYSNSSFSSPYTFVDLTPTDPSGSTLTVTSSMATGINILGDVVGNVTWSVGSGTQTGGWIYRSLKYTTFCYAGASVRTTSGCNTTSNPYPTYANGLNFSDVVVGDFTDHSGHQNGFAIWNPWKATGSTFSIINTNKNNTVLLSTNQATGPNQTEFFAGWTIGDGANAKSSGIVGICPASHCGSTNGTDRQRSSNRRYEGAYHD